jgi:hypothetical protein
MAATAKAAPAAAIAEVADAKQMEAAIAVPWAYALEWIELP